MRPAVATAFSFTASAVVLVGAALLGRGLQTRARAASHELPPWTGLPSPAGVTAAQRRERGAKFYLDSCAHCHGADARGDEGPDLHELEISDRRIATVITKGIKGEMPSFAKKRTPEEVGAIIAYLRTLQ